MPKFLVWAEEVRTFNIVVEADTLDEALTNLEANPSVYVHNDPGEYLDDSFHINEECTLDTNRVIQSDLGFWNNQEKWVAHLEDATVFHYKPKEFPDAPNVRFVRYVDA